MSNNQAPGHGQGQFPINNQQSFQSNNNSNQMHQNGQQRLAQMGNAPFHVPPLSVPTLPVLHGGNISQPYASHGRHYMYQNNPMQYQQGIQPQRIVEQRGPAAGMFSSQQTVLQTGPPREQDGRVGAAQLSHQHHHHHHPQQRDNVYVGKHPLGVDQNSDAVKRVKTDAPSSASQRSLEREAALKELARFRKRKMDYKLPEKLSTLLPDSALFAQLQDVERRVDNEIHKRKTEILEMFGICSPASENEISLVGAARRQMRVYIFGRISKQDGTDSWSLTIHGRPIESAEDSHPGGGGSTLQSLHVAKLFFTHCLKSLKIDLEGDGYERETIFWEKCRHDRELRESRFQVNRTGICPDRAKITLEIDHAKPMYIVPEKLEQILKLPSGLGKGVYSIAFVMGYIWNHAKKHNLLIQVGEIGKIKLDDTLSEVVKLGYEAKGKVFHNEEFISYTAMGTCIHGLLTPTKPIQLEYDMKHSNPYKPLCIDFHYEAPLVSGSQAIAPSSMLEARNVYQSEMEELDVDLAELYYRYCDMESAHAILKSFALDPHRTLREILALHNKDPRTLPQKSDEHMEIMSQSAPYKDPWVDDAILRYLTDTSGELRRMQQKMEADKEAQIKREEPEIKQSDLDVQIKPE